MVGVWYRHNFNYRRLQIGVLMVGGEVLSDAMTLVCEDRISMLYLKHGF